MAMKKKTDLGAALAGLVLGGSVLFLLMLTIVWLTNTHFEGKAAEHKSVSPPPVGAGAVAPGTIPTTTGTGSQAPVAPTPTVTPPAGH